MGNSLDIKRVQVEIFGEDYIVKGNAEDKHIIQVAEYVDTKMNMIFQRNPTLSSKHLAVLSALNIADELHQLKDDYKKMIQVLEESKKN